MKFGPREKQNRKKNRIYKIKDGKDIVNILTFSLKEAKRIAKGIIDSHEIRKHKPY